MSRLSALRACLTDFEPDHPEDKFDRTKAPNSNNYSDITSLLQQKEESRQSQVPAAYAYGACEGLTEVS